MEFTSLDKVQAHVRTCHEGCVLLMEKSQGVSPDSATSNMTLSDSNAAAAFSSETSSETNKHTSRNLSHPLGKCPCCPKILLLRGIFGHFGRAHCGTQFDWNQVQYLCPFCEDTGDGGPTMYSTFDETRAHVEIEHEGCYLVPIGPSRIAQAGQSPPIGKAKEEASSTAIAVRSSQRRRSSAASVDEGETSAEPNQTSSQTLYQCPSCERTFNKQGLSTHYGMIHGKKLNWDNVKIVEYEGRAYICPDCDRTFTKAGLYTHYGMVHDGKLDWNTVRIMNGGEGLTLKRQRGAMENSNREEGEEEEEEDDGPVRKSRRISARASRVVDEEESDFVSDGPSPAATAAVSSAPAKSSKQPPGLNFGPWTPEEHEAFMLGHKTYGNEWKRISTDFVPVCLRTRCIYFILTSSQCRLL